MRGRERRQMLEKRELRESRMVTARARISVGSFARLRRERTRDGEGSRRDTAVGIKLDRWILGPRRTMVSKRGSCICRFRTYLVIESLDPGNLRSFPGYVVVCLHQMKREEE